MKSSSGQISITKSHIGAMLTVTAGIAAIAFFVGVDVGRNKAAPEAPRFTLLPDAASDDALEALLREVESAQHAAAAHAAEPPSGFRAVLADARAAEPPPLPETAGPEGAPGVEAPPAEEAVAVDAPVTTIPAPEAPTAEAGAVRPMDGWAVQIASYHTLEEAETKVKELQAAGYPAYEVTALVKGTTWYRVRIAGYLSQEVAYEALPTLEQALGTQGLVVAKAP